MGYIDPMTSNFYLLQKFEGSLYTYGFNGDGVGTNSHKWPG